jgi:hypothetical protein
MAASAKVIPLSSPAQPIPTSRPVAQTHLSNILELRREIEILEAQVQAAENEVRAALESGAPVEPGLLRAFLKTIERRSVAWKAVCERELGEDYCRRVLTATRPDTFTRLVVEA